MPRVRQKRTSIATLEAKLLRQLRARGGMSRVELARKLHLAPSTIGVYVDRLIEEGFISEYENPRRDIGRPPMMLVPNPDGGQFIGVDFEAHNIMATAVDFSQNPKKRVHRVIGASDSVEKILAKIEQAIREVMSDDGDELLGIGVGVPGIVDPKRGVALTYQHIKEWRDIPLVDRLSRRFKVPVFLENNIRSMALAELWFGHGRGLDDFVCVGIRTGIAAGVVINGQLLHGKSNLAGEMGHWLCPVAPIKRTSARPATTWMCQRLQPLEEIASIPAILNATRAAIEKNGKSGISKRNGLTFDHVVEAAQAGDDLVNDVLAGVAQTLGWMICQMNALFNPQKIILAGPLVALGEAFVSSTETAVRDFSSESRLDPPVVVDSELGEFNGALGAAALALHEWKPVR